LWRAAASWWRDSCTRSTSLATGWVLSREPTARNVAFALPFAVRLVRVRRQGPTRSGKSE
jgi:hypothetical protein